MHANLLGVRFFAAAIISLSMLFAASRPSPAADELERKLVNVGKELVAKLQEKGYRNVGVLKFRVKKGEQPASDRVGTLNSHLANKLELALILKTNVAAKGQAQFGIIRQASATAATIPGASHLTAEGRQKLFEAEYPLAWGNTKVRPDAFLTGVAFITPDLRSMTVAIVVFDKESSEPEKLLQFEVKPDLEELLDSGESFTVRGVFDAGSVSMTADERKDKATAEAVQVALKVQAETAKTSASPTSTSTPMDAGSSFAKEHPLSPANPDAPISLEIWYDRQPQQLEFREGAAFVKEPRAGQEVVLVVRRKGHANPRLGVVLKVNGENTLYRQKSPDAQCTPWIFEPRLREFGIRGYQVDKDTFQPFKVVSQEESKNRGMDYGEFVGTISVSVFREQTVEPKRPMPDLSDDEADFAVLTRDIFPSKTAASLDVLKQQLLPPVIKRDVIVNDNQIEQSSIQISAIKLDPVPVMAATVRYYQPADLPR